MKEYFRIATNPTGMARLVVSYSRIKELQENGLSIEKIADIFNEDLDELKGFVNMADGYVSGEKSLSLDITTNSKDAFTEIASALTK